MLGWSLHIRIIITFQDSKLQSLYGRTLSILWGRDGAEASRSFLSTGNNGNTTDSNLLSIHNSASHTGTPFSPSLFLVFLRNRQFELSQLIFFISMKSNVCVLNTFS